MIIQTLIEILIATALIIGLFNESKIAHFEQKIFSKFKKER